MEKETIIIDITFTIKKNSLWWDGKAYPHISSGCSFGGVRAIGSDDVSQRIKKIVETEVEWFKRSYDRPVRVDKKIIHEEIKQVTLI